MDHLTITEVHPDPKPNYANTYWCHKGKYEALDKELRKLVPSSGEVENSDDHPALERYRVASNCYYDLYNNGLGNRAFEFITAFGFCAIALTEEGRDDCDDFSGHEHRDHPIELTQELIYRTESTMDAIILAAAHEQHIGETVTGTIDITPVGMTSPEGRKRVAEAQQEWDMATHALANSVQAVLDELMDRDTDKITRVEYYSQLQTLIGIRQVKQEAFLRAVAGGKEQPASATLAGTPRLSDTPTTSSIETANYVSAPNGSSWVIRDKRKGEVIAFRPDHQSAQKAMESLESTGSLA